MVLSDRLEKIVEAVPECKCAADIGCDHGYVSIELIKRNKALNAIAADVNAGPLSTAEKNIRAEGLSDRIKTVLSDGLLNIEVPDCIIISGMGGRLMRDILSFTPTGSGNAASADKSLSSCRYLVLSPQSEPDIVRRFVTEAGFAITDETMVKDSGKFYVVVNCENRSFITEKKLTEYESREDFLYGRRLIEKRDGIFKEYIIRELEKKRVIISEIEKNNNSKKALNELSALRKSVTELENILNVFETQKG